MDPLVLAAQPSRQGAPYIIDTGDVPGTEEVLLYVTDAVFYWALAFRICLVADPETQVLLCTEVFKHSGLDDLAVSFAGNKNGILVNDEDGRPSSQPAEAPVDGLAGFCAIVLMVLRINAKEPAVAQKETDEKDGNLPAECDFTEVDQHLFPRRRIEYVVIDSPVFFPGIDYPAVFQEVDIVPEGLLIPGKEIVIPVLYEFFFQDVIDRGDAEIFPLVGFKDRYDRFPERGDVKGFLFGKSGCRVFGDHVHVVILGDSGPARRLHALFLVVIEYFSFCITTKL